MMAGGFWKGGTGMAPGEAGAMGSGEPLAIALERAEGAVSVYRTSILRHEGIGIALNLRYTERLLKFLLWQKGGYRITVSDPRMAEYLRAVYAPSGARAFDYEFMGERVYGRPFEIAPVDYRAVAPADERAVDLGRTDDRSRGR